MRIITYAVLSVVAASSGAEAAGRTFGITDYTKVRVDGPYKVVMTTGVPPFARATGSSTALDRIKVEVRGDTLVIQTDPSAWGGYPGVDPGPVEVTVGTHDLASAALNGSGSIGINRVRGLSFTLLVQGSGGATIDDVEADQLAVSLAGTTSAKLSGHAKLVTAFVRGLAAFEAAHLTVPVAHFTAEGSATIDANVTQTAEVRASGPATVRFTGSPSCELHTSGSASVSGCK